MNRTIKDSRAATAIEYGLIAVFIAIATKIAMRSVGNSLAKTFNNVATNLNAAG